MKSENNILDTISDFDYTNTSICIVKSQYHSEFTDKIYDECLQILKEHNVSKLYSIEVAGSYELIYGCAKATKIIQNLDGVIAIGCVIKGSTDHNAYINNAICTSLGELQVRRDIPVGLGLLTVNSKEQAQERIDGTKGNKGKEVAEAILSAIGFKLNRIE